MYGVESKNLRKNSTEVGELSNIFLKAFTFIIKSRRLLSSPFHTHFGQSFCGAARSVRRKKSRNTYNQNTLFPLSLSVGGVDGRRCGGKGRKEENFGEDGRGGGGEIKSLSRPPPRFNFPVFCRSAATISQTFFPTLRSGGDN